MLKSTSTRSPTRPSGTPSPTATMRPTMSAPWMRGKRSVVVPSAALMEAAAALSAAPEFGSKSTA